MHVGRRLRQYSTAVRMAAACCTWLKYSRLSKSSGKRK